MSEEETREIYIGNGETTTRPTSKILKVLDLAKAKELVSQNPDKEIYIGMSEDWYFTATQIESEKDYQHVIFCSNWDTPTIEIDEVRQDCYFELESDKYTVPFKDGYNRFALRIKSRLGHDFWDKFQALSYDDSKIAAEKFNSILDDMIIKSAVERVSDSKDKS